ncbi:tetrahydromethanopterin S-methyltransferase subunit A [Patescibacteria group bacterium]|nr:tetrahydromethanopterin S-methyltransferase subunit A [Patescibacteria group bacterium]
MEEDLKNWPPVEGRYKVGNKNSSIAVCTNATVEGIELDMKKVAISGKCVTENIGIEKLIQNIVSNPYIRFLILCGKVSKGHFVGQTIIALKKNGIDKDKRIVGAKGNTPYLKNIDKELIERFRKQITPVNLTGETNSQKIEKVIDELLRSKPAEFKAEAIKIKKIEEIEAKACPEWIPDPKGFFVVSIDRTRNKLLVEHYQNNKLKNKIIGDSAEEICKTIANLDLIGDFEQKLEHSMYLARELTKAEIALKNNLDYEQDNEIKIRKTKKETETKEKPASTDEYGWFD